MCDNTDAGGVALQRTITSESCAWHSCTTEQRDRAIHPSAGMQDLIPLDIP
jgi:hypothetical protein